MLGNTRVISDTDVYIRSLSELEKSVLSIASDHLKSSFDLSRSSGFIAWKSSSAAKMDK